MLSLLFFLFFWVIIIFFLVITCFLLRNKTGGRLINRLVWFSALLPFLICFPSITITNNARRDLAPSSRDSQWGDLNIYSVDSWNWFHFLTLVRIILNYLSCTQTELMIILVFVFSQCRIAVITRLIKNVFFFCYLFSVPFQQNYLLTLGFAPIIFSPNSFNYQTLPMN